MGGCSDRDHVRSRLRRERRRSGRRSGAFPGYAQEPRADAQRDPQAPRCRLPDRRVESAGRAGVAPRARTGISRSSSAKSTAIRNSQVTVLAPTGTIGLLMDCDTTGVEPDFALVKFKKLAGGGYFKIVNQSVPAALKNLGYTRAQIKDILTLLAGHDESRGHSSRESRVPASPKGFDDEAIAKIEKALPGTFELSSAFTRFGIGEDALKTASGFRRPNSRSRRSTS